MIPQRRLTRSSLGNGVSCRIEACRRRLRTVRASDAPARLEERTTMLGFASNESNVGTNGDGENTQGQDEAEIT